MQIEKHAPISLWNGNSLNITIWGYIMNSDNRWAKFYDQRFKEVELGAVQTRLRASFRKALADENY